MTNYVPQETCQSSCPTGLWQRDKEKVCQNFCDTYLDENQKVCLKTCPSAYVKQVSIAGKNSEIYICLNAASIENSLKMPAFVTYQKNNIVVDKCPDKYREISKKRCILCEAYIFEDLCVNQCPQYTTDYNKTKTCLSCALNSDDKINFYKNSCYSSSDPLLYNKVSVSNEYNAYVDCGYLNSSGIDKQTGKCVKKCPIENEGFYNGYCERCTQTLRTTKFECYILNNMLVKGESCPIGHQRNPQKQYQCIAEEKFNELKVCPSEEKKDASGACVTNLKNEEINVSSQSKLCSRVGQRIDTSLSPAVCVNCDLVFNNRCVQFCPRGFMKVHNKCQKCSDNKSDGSTEYFNGQCIRVCNKEFTTNCKNKVDFENGATCEDCNLNCNGNKTVVVRSKPTCICTGTLYGPNCLSTLVSIETTAVQNSSTLRNTASKIDKSLVEHLSIRNNIENIFDNFHEDFSKNNLKI